jgi:flagellar biosynthesis protein FlhG
VKPRAAAPMLLISGGKGGVGKTTVAANLAAHLASKGARVLLVDLDLGLANVDVVLKLDARYTLEDVLAGRRTWRECIVTAQGGVHVLPAACGEASLANLERSRLAMLCDGLAEFAHDYDVVIGDSPAGIGADVLAFAAAAQLVWVVTTPDPAALSDAYGLIKALHGHARDEGRDLATPELVLNCVNGVEEARDLAAKLCAVCERFLARAPRLAGWLPRSHRIQEACRRQTLFALSGATNSAARGLEAHCIAELARRVARLTEARGPALLAAQA